MKHYSKEFKEEALKLSDEIGVKKAAQQLGVAYYTLADWRSIRRNAPPAKTLSAEEQSIRIRELERENAGLPETGLQCPAPFGEVSHRYYRGTVCRRQAVCFADHGLLQRRDRRA